MTIPYPVALQLGCVAEAAAAQLGMAMAIAVSDSEGNLQFFIKMDGTLPASTEIAISKAYTAAALRMPTSELGRLALPGQPLYGIEHTHSGKVIILGGGIPLRMEGRVAGGIGISGGTVDEDVRVAEAVVEVFEEMADLAAKIRPCLAKVFRNKSSLETLEKHLCETIQTVPLPRTISCLLAGSVLLALRSHVLLQPQM